MDVTYNLGPTIFGDTILLLHDRGLWNIVDLFIDYKRAFSLPTFLRQEHLCIAFYRPAKS